MAVQKIFRKLTTNLGEIKLAPQEVVVFGAIPKGNKGIERAELVDALEKLAASGELVTGQKPSSILGYYTKHLVDSGLISVEKIVIEPPKKEKAPAVKAA